MKYEFCCFLFRVCKVLFFFWLGSPNVNNESIKLAVFVVYGSMFDWVVNTVLVGSGCAGTVFELGWCML